MEKKIPATQEEFEAMFGIRAPIEDADLDAVTGGNDDKPKGKKKVKEGIPWDCPYCGAHMLIYQFEDLGKHMTKCPQNPYK